MTPTTPTKSPVDTIKEAMMKVQTVATTTMHKMDHGCVPDPEGETFHALLSAIRAINPSALSSISTQPAQKVLDPIKVEDAVTGWLVKCRPDLHIPAYSEVIASLVHRIMELAPVHPSQTEGLEEGKWDAIADSFACEVVDVSGKPHGDQADSMYGNALDTSKAFIEYLGRNGYLSLPRQKGEVDVHAIADDLAKHLSKMSLPSDPKGWKAIVRIALIGRLATLLPPSNSNP